MTGSEFQNTVFQLNRAKAGDREALNEVLTRYLPRVRAAVALSLGKVPSEVANLDDVLQEVLVSAATSLDHFEHRSDGSFMSWLTAIAINKVRDHKRHESRQKRGSGRVRSIDDVFPSSPLDVPVPAREPRPSQIARVHELEEAEMRALLRLEERYRAVIVDRDILGLSYEEIAEKLGFKTTNPPRALHSRAKAKLRELLRSFDRDTDQSGATA